MEKQQGREEKKKKKEEKQDYILRYAKKTNVCDRSTGKGVRKKGI